MTHYQKLAVLALRLVAVVAIGLGLLGLSWYLLAQIAATDAIEATAERVAGSIWYLLAGIALLLVSRPLGKAVGRGL